LRSHDRGIRIDDQQTREAGETYAKQAQFRSSLGTFEELEEINFVAMAMDATDAELANVAAQGAAREDFPPHPIAFSLIPFWECSERRDSYPRASSRFRNRPLFTRPARQYPMHTLLAALVISGATVIDGTGAPPRIADVVIEGERIVCVGPTCARPKGAKVIDAKGKYVIPGLVDMHAHLLTHPWNEKGELEARWDRPAMKQMLCAFLRMGVTTIRDPGSETGDAVMVRRLLREGKIKGPRLFTAGRILNASNFNPEPFVTVRTEEQVRDEVRWQAAAGVDVIKVYASMPPPLVKAAIDEARKHGLPVIGHVQRTTWTEAARLGISGLEHAAPWSIEYVREADRAAAPDSLFGRVYWLEHLDENAIDEMIAELAKHKVVVDPTLMAMHTKFWGDDPRYTNSPDNDLAPERIRKGWPAGRFTNGWTAEQYAASRKAWPRLLKLTKQMHDAGVMLVAGTDTPTPWIVPGASLHDELKLLNDAGIQPLDVITIATSNAARALKQEQQFGAVEQGLQADLVILDKNPLQDIANTRSIAMVIQRGLTISPSCP
jgi:imidazolonepropionase-like amidohydrolase